MVPFAVKANTTCRHNPTGIVGGHPSAENMSVLVGCEVMRSPTRDRTGFVADARHEAGHHLLANGSSLQLRQPAVELNQSLSPAAAHFGLLPRGGSKLEVVRSAPLTCCDVNGLPVLAIDRVL